MTLFLEWAKITKYDSYQLVNSDEMAFFMEVGLENFYEMQKYHISKKSHMNLWSYFESKI